MAYNPINCFHLDTFNEDSVLFETGKIGLPITFSTKMNNEHTLLQVDFEDEASTIHIEADIGGDNKFKPICSFVGRNTTHEILLEGCRWNKDTLKIRFKIEPVHKKSKQ